MWLSQRASLPDTLARLFGRFAGTTSVEASPSPVYGARLLSGLGVLSPLEGSNPSASAIRAPSGVPCSGS